MSLPSGTLIHIKVTATTVSAWVIFSWAGRRSLRRRRVAPHAPIQLRPLQQRREVMRRCAHVSRLPQRVRRVQPCIRIGGGTGDR